MPKDINDIFDPEDNDFIDEVELDEVDVDSKGSSFDMADDYNFVREKLIKSMVRGSEIIDEATKEAKTAASPRAIEAAALSVKTLTDVSKGLIDLHEKIRSIEKERYTEDGDTKVQDDAGIVLKTTLSDLLKKIEEEETE